MPKQKTDNDQSTGMVHAIVSTLIAIALVGFASYGMLELTGFNDWYDKLLIEKGFK